MNADGNRRVVIETVAPQVDGGRFAVKRVVGESVTVQADVFADGHDCVVAVLRYRGRDDVEWRELPMEPLGNDRWQATFRIERLCDYRYSVQGWVDAFLTWRSDLAKKKAAGTDAPTDRLAGAELVRRAAARAGAGDAERLGVLAGQVADDSGCAAALGGELRELMQRYPDRSRATDCEREFAVSVERPKALCSAWYELFPRSCAPGRHGTLQDCEGVLADISAMGFDVVYLPPIHPVGNTARKGRNNAARCAEDDPGSPWAIGSAVGGHMAVNPLLGTLDDFKRFVATASEMNIEVAMDLAYQCSPDHPYIREHPEWFAWRPDGTLQCAENPPKKYEDVVSFNFESEHWPELWKELKRIVLFWADAGVRIFRVDNPHTKPFRFWEWLIGEIRQTHPDTIFLAEAFTRPKVMARLAKAGFSQSYTYFTWRNTKQELTDYLTELTRTDLREYVRPNFWPNTPDILPEFLQYGGRPAFAIRLVLAATLSSNYGIYGPAFELCVGEALPDREEYRDSEKYELKGWDRSRNDSLRGYIARINAIRRENAALQTTANLRFYEVDNDQLLFYGKASADGDNIILCVVNLDPFRTQAGWIHVPLEALGIDPAKPYLVYDLIAQDRYFWQGERNFVELNPAVLPAHVFRVHRHMRRESDFDYFM